MNPTAEDITADLNKLLDFLEPFRSLANSHLGSIFTENLWSTQVPVGIRDELNDRDSIKEFVDLYAAIIRNDCPVEFANNHPKLSSFLQNAVGISVANNKKYSKMLVDLEDSFSAKGCHSDWDFSLEEFMSKKKLHEVKKSTRMTGLLSNLSRSSHVVDVGGGKGYLSSVLALHCSFKVLGLDSSEVTTCGAVKRLEKVAKLWSGDVFKKDDERVLGKREREEFVKRFYKQVITFVNPYTDVVKLLEESFREEVKGVTLTGLHTCGDLAPTSLKMFIRNKEIKAILNVGCCYHLLTEANDFREDGEAKESRSFGFPMSEFLRKKNYRLGRNARMLAAHSLERISINSELELSQTSMFYRAVLETVIKSGRGVCPRQEQVGRLAKKCKDFHEYMYKALEKLNINVQVTDKDLDELYNSYQGEKPKLTAFFLLRVTLAPVIESIILLDRILYLIENGMSNAYLVRLFDLEVSPRGFGVIAWKDFEKS